jgi:CubicO group peptidase (beta-lactamase class C family)
VRARTRLTLSLAVVASVALAAACTSGGSSATSTSTTRAGDAPRASLTPAGDWQKVAPASVGLDGSKLDAIAHTAEIGKSNCLAVVKDGKLAGEWYFHGTGPDTAQEVYSATKSYTSTLVGMAIDDGKAKLSDPASRWIPEWKGTASAGVTLRDLLSNDSGRSWSLAQDYVQLVRAPDATAFGVGLTQQHPPGTVWAYNNSAIQTLERVVAGTLGPDVPADAQQRIFGPLGMTHSRLTTDRSGHALMYMGLRSTCRDMARFGSLFLNQGRWNGRQIVSAKWVREATGAPSTPLNAAYGFLWWLNREGRIAGPLAATSLSGAADRRPQQGRLVPGAPEDLYWALGLGNQVIQVDPATKTVVVRLGTGEARPQPPTFGPQEASRVVTQAVRHTK